MVRRPSPALTRRARGTACARHFSCQPAASRSPRPMRGALSNTPRQQRARHEARRPSRSKRRIGVAASRNTPRRPRNTPRRPRSASHRVRLAPHALRGAERAGSRGTSRRRMQSASSGASSQRGSSGTRRARTVRITQKHGRLPRRVITAPCRHRGTATNAFIVGTTRWHLS